MVRRPRVEGTFWARVWKGIETGRLRKVGKGDGADGSNELSTKGNETGGGWLKRGLDGERAKGGCTEHVVLCSCV